MKPDGLTVHTLSVKRAADLKQDAKATHSKRITCFLNDLIKLGYFRKIISENDSSKHLLKATNIIERTQK